MTTESTFASPINSSAERVRLRHVEFLRDAGGERAIDVRHGDNGGFGNTRGQIADVHLAQPSSANDSNFELCHKQV